MTEAVSNQTEDTSGAELLWDRLNRIERKLDLVISIVAKKQLSEIEELLKKVVKP